MGREVNWNYEIYNVYEHWHGVKRVSRSERLCIRERVRDMPLEADSKKKHYSNNLASLPLRPCDYFYSE